MNIIGKYARHRLNIKICIILWSFWLIVGLFASDFVPSTNQNVINNTDHTKPQEQKANCCGKQNDKLHRIEIEYKTNVVQNEYIVRFNSYCLPKVREKHIRETLNGSQVNQNCHSFNFHL